MENKKRMKKLILIDLDGVLNEYTGEYKENYIPPVKDGAKDFLENLSKNYELKIFTARNKLLSAKWLIDNNLDEIIQDITSEKEPCWLYIDDRCISFDGNFSKLAAKIENFKPYYK